MCASCSNVTRRGQRHSLLREAGLCVGGSGHASYAEVCPYAPRWRRTSFQWHECKRMGLSKRSTSFIWRGALRDKRPEQVLALNTFVREIKGGEFIPIAY